MKAIALALLLFFAVACGSKPSNSQELTLDNSSKAARTASIKMMRGVLSPEKSKTFGRDLMTLMILRGFTGQESEPAVWNKLGPELDGMTAEEIIDFAKAEKEKVAAKLKAKAEADKK